MEQDEIDKNSNDETEEEYLTNLIDLMSDYDEKRVSDLIKEGFIIEAIVLLHRHIAEQIRLLLINKLENTNKRKASNDFIYIIKKFEDDKFYELVYNLDIININQKSTLNSLNNLRNKLVHGFNKQKIEKAYSLDEINRIFDEAKWTSSLLDIKIYKQP